MPIKPACQTNKENVAQILERFIHEYDQQQGPQAELLGKVSDKYGVGIVEAKNLASMVVDRQEVGLRDSNLFIHLEMTKDKKILPLVTLYSSDDWRHFRIYVLLAMTDPDSDSTLRNLAVRFETDEGHHTQANNIGAHDFCHVQLCNYINKRVNKVTPIWVPDSQPSIPLDADSQETLVLCMLTSLYGGKYVRSKFQNTEKGLLEHLDKVRALQKR